MDIRLERAGRSLSNFLEDDVSSSLGKEAQTQLDRFRDFLYGFYVGRYGYWPPTPARSYSEVLPKSVYQSMYIDFRNLYGYLADTTSGGQQVAAGSDPIGQDVVNFDNKHKNTSLPSLLP